MKFAQQRQRFLTAPLFGFGSDPEAKRAKDWGLGLKSIRSSLPGALELRMAFVPCRILTRALLKVALSSQTLKPFTSLSRFRV